MRRAPLRLRAALVAAVVAAGSTIATAPSERVHAAVADDDWIGIVNAYRAMSGLAPVGENPTWSEQGRSHSCYVLLNGLSHHQEPGNPGYSPDGHTAGMNGNVAASSAVGATARQHIDLWMTGPFHAIGILRHNLTTSGFGLCADPDTSPWRSAATLDVLRGLNTGIPRPSAPTVFPGRDATVPLHRFIAEYPNPVTMCGWSGPAGLPLVAMMPDAVTTASSSLVGPDGTPLEVCTLHPGNSSSNSTAQSLLRAENAVVVVPRDHLAPGRHTATVQSDGGTTTWSFVVDPDAPLTPAPAFTPTQPAQPTGGAAAPAATTTTTAIGDPARFVPVTPYRHADSRAGRRLVRLGPGEAATVEMAGREVAAVSANFTVVGADGPGYLTAYECSDRPPDVSTVNFTDRAVANQAVVPLTDGRLCLYSPVGADVLVDVNGWYRSTGSSTTAFRPSAPRRVYDTRDPSVPRLAPHEVRTVRPSGVPAAASAVALNVTVVGADRAGWLQVAPCGAESSEISNVNFGPGEARPNSAVVPLAADGTICLRADVATDVIVDVTGSFTAGDDSTFTALRPVRIVDTRSADPGRNPLTGGERLASDQARRVRVAGVAGIPDDARAVALNVTAADPVAAGFLTVFPCGPVPSSSNLNFDPADLAVANGAVVGLDPAGDVCVLTDRPTHLLIDVSGVWR